MRAHSTPLTPAGNRSPQSPGRWRAIASAWRVRSSASSPDGREEEGAVLILALVFLVAISLIVTGLLSFVGNGLTDTGSFTNERNVEYTATNAVNLAIQNTRYNFDAGASLNNGNQSDAFLNNPAPEHCSSYSSSGQTVKVDVYCSMVWSPFSANTRVFTYSACAANSASDASATTCAAAPLLQAIVGFDDYPSGIAAPSPNPTECQPITSNGSCGQSMTQISWQWNPVVPAITSLSPTTGPTSGGTTITIQGTGFVSGESVSFVPQSVSSGTYNAPVAGTVLANPSAGCALPTCIQVTSPSVVSGTAYYVTVTTPGGTSQEQGGSYTPTFTYSPSTPQVSGLLGTSGGSITGGTVVTIQGTGFWNAANNVYPAQVFFCLTASSCVAGTVESVLPPSGASTLDTMTAITPAVSTAGSYYVQVEVYNLYSAQTNVTFLYGVQVPIITGVSPSSAGSGTITISGYNFLTGSTVGFCLDTGGSYNGNCPTNQPGGGYVAAASATVTSPTSITVTLPSSGLTANSTYYPIVTLPAPYNDPGTYPPSQPYNEPADVFTYT